MGKDKKKLKRDRRGKAQHFEGAANRLSVHDSVPIAGVAELAVELWRVDSRARRDPSSERVLVACERAIDRLATLGFTLSDMKDRIYDENLKVRVIEHEEDDGDRRIVECITPAVFFQDRLVREAEVVTRGK